MSKPLIKIILRFLIIGANILKKMEDSVNVLKFAECRAREIMTLMEDVTSKEPKLNIQRLPYHMRRRAASHNPKRLPRSLRVKKSEETVSKNKKKHKVHKDLLVEYNSRQSPDSLWLPTHIWFAKRFHMKKMWGYQLPFQATGKRFRSSYRATVKNVLVQDLSYFCCIELKGDEGNILSRLSLITEASLGMNFASESYREGTKEGCCFLYHPNSFPFNGIGPVSFLWKPSILLPGEHVSPSTSCRQLWIWCHPSIHDELVQVLISVFELKENENSKIPPKEYNFASKGNYMKTKLHFQKEPVYVNEKVRMTILKDTLVRHRLIGPNALSVLSSVLNPVQSDEELCINMPQKSVSILKSESEDVANCPEGKAADHSDEQLSSLSMIKQYVWNCLRNPETAYSIPHKTVIGLAVDDPRLYVTPIKGNDIEKGTAKEEDLNEFGKPTTACSALWDEEIRNEVTAAQIPEDVLNKERGKYVVPKAFELKKCTRSVPVIVIHQPRPNGFASGWDIIAPQGWGMAFWIPFIYHGAQPAGFDDFCSLNLESGLPTFPCSFPDTKAGYNYEEGCRQQNLKQFHRYSRSKRPNFKILGVPSPFFMPWDILVGEWEKEFMHRYSDGNLSLFSTTVSNEKCLFTVRSVKEITNLQNICKLLLLSYKHKEVGENFEKLFKANIQLLLTTQKINLKALILVHVKFLFRGTSSNCCGIYLPNECDLKMFNENIKYFGPIESKHSLETDSLPARKRRKLLKQIELCHKTLDRPTVETLLSSAERTVIGYVSEGGYCRLRGQGYGIGHLTLTGFFTLLELCKRLESAPIVLIREQHSFQYRPATVSIVSSLY